MEERDWPTPDELRALIAQLDDAVRDAATIRRYVETQLRRQQVLGDRRHPAHWTPRDVEPHEESEEANGGMLSGMVGDNAG